MIRSPYSYYFIAVIGISLLVAFTNETLLGCPYLMCDGERKIERRKKKDKKKEKERKNKKKERKKEVKKKERKKKER